MKKRKSKKKRDGRKISLFFFILINWTHYECRYPYAGEGCRTVDEPTTEEQKRNITTTFQNSTINKTITTTTKTYEKVFNYDLLSEPSETEQERNNYFAGIDTYGGIGTYRE